MLTVAHERRAGSAEGRPLRLPAGQSEEIASRYCSSAELVGAMLIASLFGYYPQLAYRRPYRLSFAWPLSLLSVFREYLQQM